MATGKLPLYAVTLAFSFFVCHAALGANSDDGGPTSQSISVDDDTASIPDFDGDGTIGFGDFVKFAANFGMGQGDDGYDEQYDLNGDAEIGFSDFVIFAQFFGADVSSLVSIPDANLRAAIESALGKASGAPITVAEMETLTELNARSGGVGELADLTGLKYATRLTLLDLLNQSVTDISAVAGLTKLTHLRLGGGNNSIADLSPLAGLTNLEYLSLPHGRPDISALSGLMNLKELSIQSWGEPPEHQLTHISPLSGLINLRVLWLGFNNITDISPLSGLTHLTDLQLLENNITNISALSGLTNLTRLNLGDNRITNISPLSDLIKLTRLMLQINNISDISALSGLTDLKELRLEVNNIVDISALSGLTNLTRLELQSNEITDIPTLAGLSRLNGLWLGDNNIIDISGLSGLTNLRVLWLGYNEIREVSMLSGLAGLTDVDLMFNNIGDISALTGLTRLEQLDLRGNPLSDRTIGDHVQVFTSNRVAVRFDSFREGDFDIELVYLDPVPESQKKVLHYAARRWMSIITEGLPDYEFSEGWSGTCGDRSYEISAGERVDDLRIYVSTFEGEDVTTGGRFGYCGPSVLRDTEHLPVLACMGLNLKRAGDNLFTITIHEIGHGLGFLESVWDEHGYIEYNSATGENSFTGPLAIAAFDDAGGANYTGAKVRFWNNHWWPHLLDGELMELWGTYKMALSAITIESMADLGYGVDVTQADPYTLPGGASKPVAKIALPAPDRPGFDARVSWPHFYLQRGENPHGHRNVEGDFPSIFTDGGHTGGPDRAERVWGREMAFDFAESRETWDAGLPAHTAPELICGAGLMNDPIYVVDPQGRVVRTIER